VPEAKGLIQGRVDGFEELVDPFARRSRRPGRPLPARRAFATAATALAHRAAMARAAMVSFALIASA